MIRSPMTWLFGIALVLAALGQGAEAQGPGCRGGCAPAAVEGPRVPLDEAQVAAIAEALQDEYQGEAIYARVLLDHGDIRPFSNVVHAEQRHAAFLEELLEARDLPVPANAWVASEAPAYASRQEACTAAIEFEVRNVALYDRFLAAGLSPTTCGRRSSTTGWRPSSTTSPPSSGAPRAAVAATEPRRPGGAAVAGAPGAADSGCGGRCHRGAASGD